MSAPPAATRPVQVRGTVLANSPVGGYQHLTLAAPGVADAARPGHFVALAVGDDPSSTLRRSAKKSRMISAR